VSIKQSANHGDRAKLLSSPLLKTFTAIDRSSLPNSKRDSSFLAALRTNSLGFETLDRTDLAGLRDPVPFAILATLWFVFKSLVGKKHLLAGSKNKL
jgi:hypothetical protein